jgi:hypothetical protein
MIETVFVGRILRLYVKKRKKEMTYDICYLNNLIQINGKCFYSIVIYSMYLRKGETKYDI